MRKRLLFVDDEPNILRSIERMLHRQTNAWELRFAADAQAALTEVRTAHPDVIVSDVSMPGKDGLQMLQELMSTRDTADIPVIIVTGVQESHIKRRALDLGAADLLSKPLDMDELVARIRSVLRIKSYEDALKMQNQSLEQAVRQRTLELEASRLDILWKLGKAAEYRDDYTGNHVIRVGCVSRRIAEALDRDRAFAETLFLASPLHDIGKIGIPDNILRKPGKLTPAEWEIMKRHCTIGAAILRQDSKLKTVFLRWREAEGLTLTDEPSHPVLEMGSRIALTHHEKWDGTGYPAGLQGETIPIESRIVAVSDTFDALCSNRPYQRPIPETDAVNRIQQLAGRHFDPRVVAAFERALPEIRSIREELADECLAPT
ncbi:MAG: HD domain-containing phosphohydrolase [Acidobacteriota bacterium]